MTFNKFKVKILFTVPKNDEINPRDKFATLFSVVQQQYKDTILEQWDVDALEQVQNIITGADIPYEQEKLSIYYLHVHRNNQLVTQWRIQSIARYYNIKTNSTILTHLKQHNIYMNPTEIKQIEATVA
eukprot:3273030-Ditylum_brightwellii.AAC.1